MKFLLGDSTGPIDERQSSLARSDPPPIAGSTFDSHASHRTSSLEEADTAQGVCTADLLAAIGYAGWDANSWHVDHHDRALARADRRAAMRLRRMERRRKRAQRRAKVHKA